MVGKQANCKFECIGSIGTVGNSCRRNFRSIRHWELAESINAMWFENPDDKESDFMIITDKKGSEPTVEQLSA